MEITNTGLLSHISEEVITTAYCWKITLSNGNTIGLTDFDNDLKIENVLYHSSPGTKLVLINCESHASTAQTEVLVGTQITEADLRHGLLNSAQVEIFFINYTKISLGLFTLFEGAVSDVEICGNKIIMQLVGTLCNVLDNRVGALFSPQCRAQFCDSKCKLNAEKFTRFGHVSAVLEKFKTFQDSSLSAADYYYKHGIVRFLTGQNKQISTEVRSNSSNTVYLSTRVPYPIRIGDRYSILAGCDKNFDTCVTKFKNAENFRGEPHVPNTHMIYNIVD